MVNIAVNGFSIATNAFSHKELSISGPSGRNWKTVTKTQSLIQKQFSSGETFNVTKRHANKLFPSSEVIKPTSIKCPENFAIQISVFCYSVLNPHPVVIHKQLTALNNKLKAKTSKLWYSSCISAFRPSAENYTIYIGRFVTKLSKIF